MGEDPGLIGADEAAWLLADKHQQALPAAQSLTTRPSKGPKGGTKGSRLPPAPVQVPVQKPRAKKPASIGKSSTCRERNRRRGITSAPINSYEGCSVRLHDCSIVYSDR
eukprot:scaffold41506_cov155-Skeletonema_dohrnii-CCMP3373.AAC.1